jgi:D-serine deaminase-like pyridoxal phosphate-dependent protein
MNPIYHIDDISEIFSPVPILFRDLVEANIDEMIRVAGNTERLRPHCKTHKMAEVTKLEVARGISKHKAATFAEVEMLADAGATDIVLAYNPVGPNITRAIRVREQYPDMTFSVTADNPDALAALATAMHGAGQTVEVLVDINIGMNRTGLLVGDEAFELYRQIVELDGVVPGGLHLYDGHNQQVDIDERLAAVDATWHDAMAFRERLDAEGWSVPRLVCGGTPTFPLFAAKSEPGIESSPGTTVLHDAHYGLKFPDLNFTPAVLVLTRCISRPGPDLVTVDIGNKAVAADPAIDIRTHFPDLPDAKPTYHNEEHLVLQTPEAHRYKPGDVAYAVPGHICPTMALHREVPVVAGGKVVDTWAVTARDRKLTI